LIDGNPEISLEDLIKESLKKLNKWPDTISMLE
jgi:hypothetical protein